MRLLGLALAAALVTACAEAPAPQAVRLAVATAPVTLDPRHATDAVSYRLTRLLYRSLVDFDAGARPVPALARWEALSPMHFRFRLGETGRTFSDGSRLIAADVVATYRSILAPGSTSPQRGALANVASVEAVDADTVDFRLQRPDPLFPGLLTTGILPAAAIERGHDFGRSPIGSGTFRLLAWPREGRVVLERRSDGLRAELLAIADPTVRALKLVRGEADIVQGDLPPEILRWLEARAGIVVARVRGAVFSYLGFRLDDPLTGRIEVRRAIGHAIDREGIVEHLLDGAAQPAGAILPPWHWAGHPRLRGLDHDPDRARALLAAAGYAERRPRLRYATSNNPLRVRIATVIAHQLERVGFDVELVPRDWGTFYGDVQAGRFQMYGLSWVALKMPDIFRYAFHSGSIPPTGANRGRYASAAADALIERAERLPDAAARVPVYHALQERLLEDLPYVPLWYEDHVAAWRHTVCGYRLDADGSYDALASVALAR